MKTKNCTGCSIELGLKDSMVYIDGSNAAISKNSGQWCVPCYTARFGRRSTFDEHGEYRIEQGVLDIRNLLASGDFQHRDSARANFMVELTPNGSRVAR
jgi:hypothetical protein